MDGPAAADLNAFVRENAYASDLYEVLHRGTPGDVRFYTDMCRGALSVLELGCGYGRVLRSLVDVARLVVGVDCDAGLLERAEQWRVGTDAHVAERVVLLQRDMASLALGCRFDRVLIPFGGLQCLLNYHEQVACLARCHALLGSQGRLVLDVYAAEELHVDDPAGAPDVVSAPWDGPEHVVSTATPEGDCDVYEYSRCSAAAQRIDVVYEYRTRRGPSRYGVIRQRYLLRDELARILDVAGFRIETWHSDFHGSPKNEEAERHVIVATPV